MQARVSAILSKLPDILGKLRQVPLRRFLAPPSIMGDEEKRRGAYWLNIALIADFISLALFMVACLTTPSIPTVAILFMLLGLLVIVCLRVLLMRGYVDQAGYGVILLFTFLVSVSIYYTGSLHTAVAGAYVLLVITAGLVISQRMLRATLVLQILTVTGLALAEWAGMLPQPNGSLDLVNWAILLLCLIYAGIFATLMQKNTSRALAQAREEVTLRAAELSEANASLRKEITDRKQVEIFLRKSEARLLHDASHDALTGLPNRTLLIERLEKALRFQKRHPRDQFALLFMDLDRFKDINDSLGHNIGDQLLVAVAQRVRDCLRSVDTLARLGGDEFVILIGFAATTDQAVQVAERIQTTLKQPFDLKGLHLVTSASIGIVLSDPSRESSEDMLRDADIAMYRAKALGRARHQLFDVTWRDEVLTRVRLEADLRRALKQGEIEVYYQPIIALAARVFTGFEALARWRHPERGLLPPGEFITLAEESLLIIPLDYCVISQACRQFSMWQGRFNLPFTLNANLSSKHFTQPDLIAQIQYIQQQTHFPVELLRLEITETSIMDNVVQATGTIQQLKALGMRVSIDDFGTGYSSLTYLFQLPVNTLKIDRNFISQMGADARKTEVVRTIIQLAHTLGMDVIAEGVETEEQLARLREMGCDFAQGFLFSPPMDAQHAEEYLARWANQPVRRFLKAELSLMHPSGHPGNQ